MNPLIHGIILHSQKYYVKKIISLGHVLLTFSNYGKEYF